MGCNCQKASNVEYQVTFKNGHTETFSSIPLAQAAIRTQQGGMMRAVKKV